VGARPLLVAWNVFLNTENVAVARAVAREIRARSGGLTGLKAIGVRVKGRAQVSMNITDLTAVSISAVFRALREAAVRHGAAPESAEIIGLVPQAAVEPDSEWTKLVPGFSLENTLERRLEAPLPWP
jgi:glutamate formiminotransferase